MSFRLQKLKFLSSENFKNKFFLCAKILKFFPLCKGVSQDYNKPLFIPAYSDSIQAIMGQGSDGGRINLDIWKHQYTTHFPQTVILNLEL